MQPRHRLCLLVGVVVAAACKPSAPPASTSSDASSNASDASATSDKNVTEAQARQIVESWVSAQNAGNFPTYEALYAPRFEGIRRSGSQTARLDRARWMRERERMFKLKTTVSVKEIVITTSHEGADVHFVQTWISDAYRDEGPKRIVLVRDKEKDGGSGSGSGAAKLKIAREEMLASKVLAPGALPEERFAFAVHVPTVHLVLARGGAVKEEWMSGAPKTVSLNEPVTTRRDANVSKLPPELAAWTGKKVELFGKSGVACEGTVSGLAVIGRVIPHFGTVGRWNGTGDHAGEPKPTPSEIAREAWDLSVGSDDGRLLVGEVKSADKGDCAGALWGRAVVNPKPVLVEGKAADATTKALALAELRKTKAYAETQARYVTEKEPKDPPRWEDFDARVTTLVFAHPTLGTTVSISVSSGTGCGTFGGSASAVWEQKGSVLTALRDPEPQTLAPVSAGDVDGDGKIDLVLTEGLLRSKAGKLDAPVQLTIPFLDCGC